MIINIPQDVRLWPLSDACLFSCSVTAVVLTPKPLVGRAANKKTVKPNYKNNQQSADIPEEYSGELEHPWPPNIRRYLSIQTSMNPLQAVVHGWSFALQDDLRFKHGGHSQN